VSNADASMRSVPSRLQTQAARGRDHLINLSRHADTAIRHQLVRARGELVAQDRVLQSLSYKNVLRRGYAVIRDELDKPVSTASALAAGTAISIEFSDGRVHAVTGEGGTAPSPSTPPKKRAAKSTELVDPPKQGTLF
jgi:exodeoxyribonuclease VII large subunit